MSIIRAGARKASELLAPGSFPASNRRSCSTATKSKSHISTPAWTCGRISDAELSDEIVSQNNRKQTLRSGCPRRGWHLATDLTGVYWRTRRKSIGKITAPKRRDLDLDSGGGARFHSITSVISAITDCCRLESASTRGRCEHLPLWIVAFWLSCPL